MEDEETDSRQPIMEIGIENTKKINENTIIELFDDLSLIKNNKDSVSRVEDNINEKFSLESFKDINANDSIKYTNENENSWKNIFEGSIYKSVNDIESNNLMALSNSIGDKIFVKEIENVDKNITEYHDNPIDALFDNIISQAQNLIMPIDNINATPSAINSDDLKDPVVNNNLTEKYPEERILNPVNHIDNAIKESSSDLNREICSKSLIESSDAVSNKNIEHQTDSPFIKMQKMTKFKDLSMDYTLKKIRKKDQKLNTIKNIESEMNESTGKILIENEQNTLEKLEDIKNTDILQNIPIKYSEIPKLNQEIKEEIIQVSENKLAETDKMIRYDNDVLETTVSDIEEPKISENIEKVENEISHQENYPKIVVQYFDDPNVKKDDINIQIINRIIAKTNESVKMIKNLDDTYSSYETGTRRIVFKKFDSPTFYLCPPRSFWSCLYDLPYGYEVSFTSRGKIYFINHLDSNTTSLLPTEVSSKKECLKSDKIEQSLNKVITLDLFISKKVKSLGMELKDVSDGVYIKKISQKSIFKEKLKEGDIIQRINNIPVTKERDIPYFLIPKNTIVVSVLRFDSQNNDQNNNKNVKGALKSKNRAEYLKKFPARVHFSEAPIVINYQIKSNDTWKGSKFIDNFDDILKVSFPDGTFRTQRFTRENVISSFIKPFVKSLKISEDHCFTLALLPRGSTDIEYFGRHDLVSTVNSRKLAQDQTECFLVMYTYPRNVNSYNDSKYYQLVDFLFQQFRLFLFTARFRNIFIIQKNDLHQLIALSATIDFLSSKSKMQNDILEENTQTVKKEFDTEIKQENDKIPSVTMRLSTINLEEHPIYPHLSTIHDLRKDLDNYFISCLMINVFDIIVPNELKFYFLSNKGTVANSKAEFLKVCDRIPNILQKSQLCFIKACVECKISPIARFRVVVQTYLNGKTCLNTSRSGFPETLAVSSRALEFHREYATELILYLKNIVGVVASSIDNEHTRISIFSMDEKYMTVSIQNYHYKALLWMLAAGCNELWREEPKITIPIFDVSNKSFRCDTNEIPKYSDIHILIPSFWNYSANICSFFHRLFGICSHSIQDVYQALSPFFVIYENPKNKTLLRLPFESKSQQIKIFHLEFEEPSPLGELLATSEESLKSSQTSLSCESDQQEIKSDEVDIYLSELSKKVDNVTRNSDIKISLKNI